MQNFQTTTASNHMERGLLTRKLSQDVSQLLTPESSLSSSSAPGLYSQPSLPFSSTSSIQSGYTVVEDGNGPSANIPAVLDLLSSSDNGVQAVAAGTLKVLSHEPMNCLAICSYGAINQLVELLLTTDNCSIKESVLGILKNLACTEPGSHTAIDEAGGIKAAVQLLAGNISLDLQQEAASLLLALAECSGPSTVAYITSMAAAGAIPLLLQLLCASNSSLQTLVLRLLAALAGQAASRVAIVASGGAPALLGLLSSSNGMATEVTQVQRLAVDAISSLAIESASHADIISWGGVQALVELLQSRCSEDGVLVDAATALGRLAKTADAHAVIAAAKGVATLLSMLDGSSEIVQAAVCKALSRLAVDATSRTMVAAAGGARTLTTMLNSSSEAVKYHAAQAVQNLAVDPEIASSIAATDAVKHLVELLVSEDANSSCSNRLLAAAAGCLSNIAHDSDGCAAIAAAGGIDKLVSLLDSEDVEVLSAAAGAVAKLAWEIQHCPSIAAAGGVKALVSLLHVSNTTVLDSAVVALQNLTYDSPDIRLALGDDGTISQLVQLLECGNTSVQKHAAAVLHNLAIQRNNRRPIAAAGAIEPLSKLMDSGNAELQSTAGSAVGKLVMEPVARNALIRSSAARQT